MRDNNLLALDEFGNPLTQETEPQEQQDVREHVTIKVKTRLKAGANCCDNEGSVFNAGGGWGGDYGGGWGGDYGGGYGGDYGGGGDWGGGGGDWF